MHASFSPLPPLQYMTSQTSIDIDLSRKEMVILGTCYAGEMKKGIFSLMHYLMPLQVGNVSFCSQALSQGFRVSDEVQAWATTPC